MAEKAPRGLGRVGECLRALDRVGGRALQRAEHLQHGAAVGARLTAVEPGQLVEQDARFRIELDDRDVALAPLDQPACVDEAPVDDRAALDRIDGRRLVVGDVGLRPTDGKVADRGEQLALAQRLGGVAEDAPVQVQQQGRVEGAARRGERTEEVVG